MNERMNKKTLRWVGAWHVIQGRDDGGMAQGGGSGGNKKRLDSDCLWKMVPIGFADR